MNSVFPGDRLWGRYRVERLIAGGGAWLTTLSDSPRKADASESRFLLIPLNEPASNPLAELLSLLRHSLHFEEEAPVRPRARRRKNRARVQRYGRKSLPVLGDVEWIGEQSGDGVAILCAPTSIPLNAWLQANGPLTAPQVLPLLLRFTRGLALLTQSMEAGSPRPAIMDRFTRSLARLITPDSIAIDAASAQWIFRRQFTENSAATAAPAFADFMAPELFRADLATPAALVFGAARLAATMAGQPIERSEHAEVAWARVAEWATGKRDPAKEFLSSAAAVLPENLREILARCLSKHRSRRLPDMDKFTARLKDLAGSDWAQAGVSCPVCGFVLAANQAAQACLCCGTAPSSAGLPAVGTGASEPGGTRSKRRGTTAILKRPQAGAATAVAAPKIEGMTVVEAGMFLSGEDKTPRSLRAFAIDTLPVTEAQYKKFLIEIGKTPRADGPGSREAEFDNHPVTRVSWYEANEFAEHYGKRLPTVFEWEKAARGSDGRKFPFGNSFREPSGRSDESSAVVGTFPEGASPLGVQDMTGNILQWTSSARRAGDRLFRAVKGSCYLDGSPELSRCSSVQYLPPETSEPHLGFRCVKDVD